MARETIYDGFMELTREEASTCLTNVMETTLLGRSEVCYPKYESSVNQLLTYLVRQTEVH